uniref:Putative secreted protein n=1 Tax=Anopheles darlingi TaxID=43151 RepID=A0A2M4DIP8_ANODA
MVAWYVLSKLSYINLVISDVLPTLCSPRKTSLNFRSGFPKSPDDDIVLGMRWWAVHFLSLSLLSWNTIQTTHVRTHARPCTHTRTRTETHSRTLGTGWVGW